MIGAKQRQQGVPGEASASPGQGAEVEETTFRHSCSASPNHKPVYFRISLPARHGKRWLALPPTLRKKVAGIVFGSFTAGVDLTELLEAVSELRETRTTLNNALQLALKRGTPISAEAVTKTIGVINELLGE